MLVFAEPPVPPPAWAAAARLPQPWALQLKQERAGVQRTLQALPGMKDLSAAGGHIWGAQGMLKCICMMVNYVCKALKSWVLYGAGAGLPTLLQVGYCV